MRRRTLCTTAGAVALAALLLSPATSDRAAAQTAYPDTPVPTGPAPRTADGHPDLSGVWWFGTEVPLGPPNAAARQLFGGRAADRSVSYTDLYQPWAKEKLKTLGDKDDPGLRCIPVAFGTLNVSLLGDGFVGQIVQTPTFVVMLTETYQGFRIVPIDGRKHRDDVLPSYRGDSVGRWDGDTLIVDETNFADTNWMFAEGRVSFHSDALHIVERYHRLDKGHLVIDATIEDPKVLTAPWKVPTQTLVLAPFDQIMEIGCSGTETASLMDAAAKDNYGKK
jgi:hypothetical protein